MMPSLLGRGPMSCPPQAFHSVTPAQFARIVEKAAAAGIRIDGSSGELSHLAITIRWRFESETGVFAVQCTRRPFMVSCAQINSRIKELVGLCQLVADGRPIIER
jgi:hypothetical protein